MCFERNFLPQKEQQSIFAEVKLIAVLFLEYCLCRSGFRTAVKIPFYQAYANRRFAFGIFFAAYFYPIFFSEKIYHSCQQQYK